MAKKTSPRKAAQRQIVYVPGADERRLCHRLLRLGLSVPEQIATVLRLYAGHRHESIGAALQLPSNRIVDLFESILRRRDLASDHAHEVKRHRFMLQCGKPGRSTRSGSEMKAQNFLPRSGGDPDAPEE